MDQQLRWKRMVVIFMLSNAVFCYNSSFCWALNTEGSVSSVFSTILEKFLFMFLFGFCKEMWVGCAGIALLKFKERVSKDPFNALLSWDFSVGGSNSCSWFGVKCSKGKVVTLLVNSPIIWFHYSRLHGYFVHLCVCKCIFWMNVTRKKWFFCDDWILLLLSIGGMAIWLCDFGNLNVQNLMYGLNMTWFDVVGELKWYNLLLLIRNLMLWGSTLVVILHSWLAALVTQYGSVLAQLHLLLDSSYT